MTPPTADIKARILQALTPLYDNLHQSHFYVGEANDSNLLRMPKIEYNTDGSINERKATWHRIVNQMPDTIVNSPVDIEHDCWFAANMKSPGKLDLGSEPFRIGP